MRACSNSRYSPAESSGDTSWWDDHLDICFAAVLATMVPAKVAHHTMFRSQDDLEHAGVPWWAARAMRGLRLIERA